MASVIESWSPDVPATELADLRSRLRSTRWPEPATDPVQGIALDRLSELCRYWAEEYDWRRCEQRLQRIGWFRTEIDGLPISFLHSAARDRDALPLVLTHGWPGSVIEFEASLGLLTAAGFACVVPSLPGYGWSARPSRTGWNVVRVAHAWAELMHRLGYDRYGAVGSDWGTSVSASLAQADPDHVAGIHLVPPLAPADRAAARTAPPTDDGSGYSLEQRTRPQTIGYALTDSPSGLAAWIVEKIDAWVDPRSELSTDTILDNLMHYWLPRTGASSARLYWESLRDVTRWLEGPLRADDVVSVSTGCSVFPYELQRPTRQEAARRFPHIRYWNEPERGGHFAAWEQPELFVAELEASFASVR